MAQNGAPESWDQEDDVANKMGQLNVSAPSFVPNVNAPAFTPSWLPADPAPAAPEKPAAAPASPVQAEPAHMQVPILICCYMAQISPVTVLEG